jgi:general secretion pathway protein E
MLQQMRPAARAPDRRTLEGALVERLRGNGKLDDAAAERALRIGKESGRNLEAVLTSLGLVTERDLVAALSAELGLPVASPKDFPEAPLLEEAISAKFVREARVLPIAVDDTGLALAMADPLDQFSRRAIEMSTGLSVRSYVAAPSDIESAFELLYSRGKGAIADIADEIGETNDDGVIEDINRLRDLASEAPVIRLVNRLIARAIEERASDIHVEPFASRLLVRYRIDGVLREGATPPQRLQAAVVSRIKIMARLNIAERRLPQDGRIRFTYRGREFDLRVSTMPTLHGEAAVMRILDRESLVSEFGLLGFAPDVESAFIRELSRPQGIVLVTGPTGSGKTTTLYTGLLRLNDPGKKLFTVEDPIEYELEGVNQVQVQGQIGLRFAQVLRSILRHDPDVVMIGEIRDRETAEVAAQAALTGHLVLSTLHTNDAASSVTRLLDMGVESYLVTSTVNAVLAQRLVRKLCVKCRRPYEAPPDLMTEIVSDGASQPATFYRPGGCEACRQSGYHGRMVITELLVVTDEIRQNILKLEDARKIAMVAAHQGMRTMYADGLSKVAAGLTTLEEVLRVTREA